MTSGTNYRWVTALVAALSLGLVVAIVVPRYSDDTATNWVVTAVLTAVTFAAVLLATRERVGEGKHVRDDTLPR